MARIGRFRFSARKKINISGVITKIAVTIIALWVGGEIITKVAEAIGNATTPFHKGFTLIGFNEQTSQCTDTTSSLCLNGTVSTTGILSVVGLVAMASIIMDFVNVRMT